ncbi:restriction endonuclease subunit S [Skermania sp. ID1734]|uniref:restriction endonuclease subunit S n=1 Tax=Skermania sp. ID1734 TaxID=2597516 RepID=UPI00117C0B8C|nr:restriction endonuclease subunit S [Skermania sp. ID1734]TSD98087.1 restriction endonuclease subunit S [Skermania sp. ID1734]
MRTVTLRDVVSVVGGGTPRKSVGDYYGGHIPWVTPKDMKRSLIESSEITLTPKGVTNSPAKLIPAGSVLLVVRSGVLKHTLPVALTTKPVTVNQDMKALVPNGAVYGGYLARLVKALQPKVLSWVRATTADNFPIDNLLDLEICLPPLDEQRRIAAILDQADAIRTKRRNVFAEIDALEESIFRDMFGDVVAGSTVEDVAAADRSSIRTGPFGSQLLHGEFVDDGIAVLGLDNVVNNQFRWAERRYITPKKYAQLARYTVHAGDVLISIMGTVGRCAVVPEDIPTAINTKHLCAITVDRQRLEPLFLRAAFLWHPESRAHLRRQTKGSIMDGLNMGIIKSMPIPVPDMDQQKKFVTRIAAVTGRQIAARQLLVEHDELFASLQSRAFRGEL